jgi:hypothetical protein
MASASGGLKVRSRCIAGVAAEEARSSPPTHVIGMESINSRSKARVLILFFLRRKARVFEIPVCPAAAWIVVLWTLDWAGSKTGKLGPFMFVTETPFGFHRILGNQHFAR